MRQFFGNLPKELEEAALLDGCNRLQVFFRIVLPLAKTALATLAIIVTSTPGTAWIDLDPDDNHLLLHVFDLKDEDDWAHTIKTRYEPLLMEIFR